MELFWNSLDNAPLSIVFYLEMKVEVEVGVHDIRSWFTPRLLSMHIYLVIVLILYGQYFSFICLFLSSLLFFLKVGIL